MMMMTMSDAIKKHKLRDFASDQSTMVVHRAGRNAPTLEQPKSERVLLGQRDHRKNCVSLTLLVTIGGVYR